VIKIIQSETFKRWLLGLKDRAIRARVHIRMQRIEAGNMGDVKPVGEGISELRIDYGPGYRVYFTQRGQCIVILFSVAEIKLRRYVTSTVRSRSRNPGRS
jgi:putative addiction module killer protein